MKVKTKKVLALLFAVFALSWATQVSAKGILVAGELIINVTNPCESTWITVQAVSVVWGKWQDGYPVRTDLGYYKDYKVQYCFDHIGSADGGLQRVGYGRYKITIDGYSTYVDYRDCDYQGEFPGDYFRADIEVTYNKTTHTFTRVPSSGNIWNNRYHPNNRNITQFKIPVTATNNFSGGQIKMDGAIYGAPKTLNWGWTTTHTIEAVTLQHDIDGRVYTFSKWSDGNTNTSRQVTPDDQHSSYTFQANFTSKPETPKNFSGTTYNNHPKLTWTPNTGSSIGGYWIYRNFDKQGFEHCATVTPKTTSQWIDYEITTSEPNKIVAYRMDCYDNNGQHSDLTGSVFYWADIEKAQSLSSSSSAPALFALFPNYPNPFNPVTAIQYELAEERRVILSVYNLLGEEVKRLVDENQPAGAYRMRWDGTDGYGQSVSGGLYITKMEAVGPTGRFVQTRKMLFLK